MEIPHQSYSFRNCEPLVGPKLILAPLKQNDLSALANALISATTWFSKTRGLDTEEKFRNYFGPMIARADKDESLTLVARLKSSGEIVGMSTFQYPGPGFRKVEIGFSWVAEPWHRTFVNREMKLLMLTHAFEEMKTIRVEFSVHPANEKSNTAMKRLGATLEGTLRKWRVLSGIDDGNRNMYSIIDDEWSGIKSRLQGS